MMLASLAITIFLAFSASAVQSESTTEKPPPPPSRIRHPPPPPSKSHHPPPPPPPRPRKNHQPPPPDEKTAKSTTAKSKGLNAGKTVGLVFCGVAAMLQIGAVGYLTYKRNQLYQVDPSAKQKCSTSISLGPTIGKSKLQLDGVCNN